MLLREEKEGKKTREKKTNVLCSMSCDTEVESETYLSVSGHVVNIKIKSNSAQFDIVKIMFNVQ
jgi:hypothetical protein